MMANEYWKAHRAVEAARGKAAEHPRVTGCGRLAFYWAPQGAGQGPRDVKSGLEYSGNVDDYQPMCRSCHNKLDYQQGQQAVALVRNTQTEKFKEIRRQHMRRQNADPEFQAKRLAGLRRSRA